LHGLVQVSVLNLCKSVPMKSDMTKHTARLLPVAIVVTGFIATCGGYFTNH